MSKLLNKFSAPPLRPDNYPPTPLSALAGPQPYLMLHIVDKAGRQWAEPYAYLLEIHMPADKQRIELRFTHSHIVIKGIRLQPLFKELLTHTCSSICAETRDFIDENDSVPHIFSVDVKSQLYTENKTDI